jgi:hypothetical protein
MRNQTTVNENPPNTVVLPCGCVVTSKPGALADCAGGCTPVTPEHLRPVIRPRTRG